MEQTMNEPVVIAALITTLGGIIIAFINRPRSGKKQRR
jgi:hypothetical protein